MFVSDMSVKDATVTGSTGVTGLPPTQLLERNIDRIQGTHLLLLGVPNDTAVVPLFRGQSGVLLSFDYSAHLLQARQVRDSGAGLTPVFTADYPPPEPRHDVVVAYLQKGKEANDCLIALAGSVVAPGGRVFLVGENSAGIKPYAAKLEERVGPVEFSDAARHCVLYEARATEARVAVRLEDWEKRFHVAAGTGGIDVVTLPGVFSHGRLDEGTALLLRHLPTDIRGAVLDFGCGSGVIGATIKSRHPDCQVSLVDSNAFALVAAQRTFGANGLTPHAIHPVDGIDGVGDQQFDLIVSNPPFHQGIGTDYTVVSRFLESCAQHLTDNGVLLMVANRFLPYERMIPKAMPVSLVTEDAKFKVLKGRSNRSGRARR